MDPRIDIFVDASLNGLGGVLGNFVYKHTITHQPGYCIAHWEAINILVAIRTFSQFIKGKNVTIWCDSQVSVSILNSGRGRDKNLQSIARNIWLIQAGLDIDVQFSHIRGKFNIVADLLSRWHSHVNPVSSLIFHLNALPIWVPTKSDCLVLDNHI
jgi:hypothetical protein